MRDKRILEPNYLREYDIRGIIGPKFNEDDFRSIGRGFGSVLRENNNYANSQPSVVVGYDGRLTSIDLSEALCAGLQDSGVDIVSIGCGPTPMLYYATQRFCAQGGMMVTGSHNTSDYNGIKMVMNGKPFYGEDIQKLGLRIKDGSFTSGSGFKSNRSVKNLYVQRLLEDLQVGKEMRVAWDPGNGAAGEVLQLLIEDLPGEHFVINEKIDGNFPAHHPDPTIESNLSQLKVLVREKNCDLGIGFDGDGDRIGVIDGTCRVLWGDQLLVILAREVLSQKPKSPIIVDVKASKIFFDEISKLGGVPIMAAAGHSLIKAKMAELESPLAGEMSGHIFFADKYYGYDDALYAAIRLLSVLSKSENNLSEIRDSFPEMMNTPELRFDCADELKFNVIKEVHKRLLNIENIKVLDIDGVRVETKDGWWLLRASNTQAALVGRCESDTEEGLLCLKNEVSEQLIKSGIKPPSNFN
ncbi:MAG: phosphoglucomutase/phosphomannomutase PgmG [Rhodospirillales bacterium]